MKIGLGLASFDGKGNGLRLVEIGAGQRTGTGEHRGVVAREAHLAARRAATGPEFEQVIGLAHDGFLMLHDEDGVAAIAQPFHHADQLAHVARVESDAWLIEHEERVDERIAEAGGEIDPLDFAAAEGPRGAVQREVAKADFQQVGEADEDAIAELLGGIIAGGQWQTLEESMGFGEGEVVDLGDGEGGGWRIARWGTKFNFADKCVPKCNLGTRRTPLQLPRQCLRLESRAMADGAAFVSAIAGEEDADVHLVGLRLHPLEIALNAIPAACFPEFIQGCAIAQFAFDDEGLHPRFQIAKGLVDGNAARLAMAEQILLAFDRDAALPRFHHAIADADPAIGQGAFVVDLDGAAEAATGGAGALGIVEGEKRGRGLAERRAIVGADPGGGEAELGYFGGAPGSYSQHLHLAGAVTQPRFDRLGETGAVLRLHEHAILDHAQDRRRDFLFAHRFIGALNFAVDPDAQEALLLESGENRRQAGLARHWQGKADENLLAGARRQHLFGDLGGTQRPDLATAMGTGQRGQPGEEELQVIGNFRHGPDGAARGLDGVALLNGDGRRETFDVVDLRFVHALQELAGVGREGFDVAALALGVERVEGEGGFPGTAQPGYDGEGMVGNIDVDILEVVLARAANSDVAGTHGGKGGSRPGIGLVICGLLP